MGNEQTETGSVRLTSVSVGGLVEHEHGIINLVGRQTTVITWRSLSLCLFRSVLPRDILPDLSPSQVLQGGAATDGQKRGGASREGGDCRRATGYREELEGAKTGKCEEILYMGNRQEKSEVVFAATLL